MANWPVWLASFYANPDNADRVPPEHKETFVRLHRKLLETEVGGLADVGGHAASSFVRAPLGGLYRFYEGARSTSIRTYARATRAYDEGLADFLLSDTPEL